MSEQYFEEFLNIKKINEYGDARYNQALQDVRELLEANAMFINSTDKVVKIETVRNVISNIRFYTKERGRE